MFSCLVLWLTLSFAASAAPQSTPYPPQPPSASVEEPWPPAATYRPGNGISVPRIVREAKPSYTAAAMKAKIQGRVMLEAIVNEDGSVGAIRVKRSLDQEHGLDEAAVQAMKRWQFTPGLRDGEPVRVLVEVEMTFTLK